jgi:hypothetical protein
MAQSERRATTGSRLHLDEPLKSQHILESIVFWTLYGSGIILAAGLTAKFLAG